jgi:hypothetical protein
MTSKNELVTFLADLAFGLSFSGFVASFMPEAIHAVSTITTGLALTTAVFFLNRWLKKSFPDK